MFRRFLFYRRWIQLLRLAICVRRRHAIRHLLIRHCYHATRYRALLYAKHHGMHHRALLWCGRRRGTRCPVPLWHETHYRGTRYSGSCARSSRCVRHGRQTRVPLRFHGRRLHRRGTILLRRR